MLLLCKFCEEVLGYDSLKGEIAREQQVKNRYCDLALKIDGSIRVLIEAKAVSAADLSGRHIEQAGNYASPSTHITSSGAVTAARPRSTIS